MSVVSRWWDGVLASLLSVLAESSLAGGVSTVEGLLLPTPPSEQTYPEGDPPVSPDGLLDEAVP